MSESRILVIDDELGMREGCRRALASQGYQVEVADDGEAGWRRIQEGGWDLALVDIKMPGLGGIELLARIQESDPDLVSIVITGYATLETAIQATKNGAYDLLPKPFSSEELFLVVRRGLERRQLALEARRLQEERERSLLLLAEERSRLRAVLDSLADGVLVANREGQLALYNPAALFLLGLDRPPAIGTSVKELLAGTSLADLVTLAPVDAHGVPATVIKDVSHAERALLVSVAPVADRSGEPLGTVALLRDVTSARALERLKSQFVSMTSHELRTPLAAVQTYVDTLLGGFVGELGDEQRAILERCGQRLEALVSLVDDLLDMSRLESGSVERRIVAVDVAQAIREAIELLRPAAEQGGIAMQSDCPPGLPPVEIDRDDLARLLSNLASNAVKYNRPGGQVTIRARDDGYYLRLEVVDTGLGIPAEALPRLFGEFYRVKRRETAHITGTGLGLAIVKRIAESYKGRVEVQSELGKGSTFTVLLPFRQSVEEP